MFRLWLIWRFVAGFDLDLSGALWLLAGVQVFGCLGLPWWSGVVASCLSRLSGYSAFGRVSFLLVFGDCGFWFVLFALRFRCGCLIVGLAVVLVGRFDLVVGVAD